MNPRHILISSFQLTWVPNYSQSVFVASCLNGAVSRNVLQLLQSSKVLMGCSLLETLSDSFEEGHVYPLEIGISSVA